ncbi:protein FAM43B [Alosa sapidissima]|uniref:protein FAM43B n=1 Tax=Alosa sapidissima TaxID=34773 RepID=UPI001C0A2024|nr:protein FAM43B [Alosa sapidissima]
MLPWRRSKFVLVKDEEKSKPKSLGAGLTYHSLLSSLLHSCPDLRPDCPFHWLASVFQSKRQKVELNREEPAYSVRYLGSAVTILAKGEGCVQEAVAKIWQHSNYGEQSLKLKLSVGPHGIRMGADASGRKKPSHLFSLSRITYCAAEAYRPKIFAWIYRHQVKNKAVVLRCHAVLLPKADKTRALALSLLQNASSSFSEFKRLKRQSDFRHCRQQLLGEGMVPVAPRRRLLNGQCHYQPPADKPSSATRLCSITEEEEEEDEDSEQEGEDGEEEEVEDDEGKDVVKETGKKVTDRGSAQLSERDVRKIVSGLGECTISCSEDGQITISTLL